MENARRKKILFILGILLLLILVSGVSYFFGTKSNKTNEPTLTPTISEAPATTPTSEPTSVLIATGSITPSKKLSPTKTPTPTPTLLPKTKTLNSDSSLDGFRSSNGGGNATLELRAGRNQYLVSRGFVSFDLSSFTQGLKVQRVTLRLYQAKIIGSPYSLGGNLKIDHLTYGDSLDDSDYGMAALSSNFTTLSSNTSIEWKDSDVTDQLKDDIANARSRSQFRIHFQTENVGGDTTGDFAYFEAAENNLGTGNTPQLVVIYY